MSYSRIFGKNNILDEPTLYQYLLMNVEDAEYPTAVPLAVGLAVLVPCLYGAEKLAEKFGIFSAAKHKEEEYRAHISYLNLDGP